MRSRFTSKLLAFCMSIVLAITLSPALAFDKLSSYTQDKKFRERITAGEMLRIEKEMIANENGVFILFTPTHGTPQMISEQEDIPDGLIPKKRMVNYETTIKPRVHTTHRLPAANVKCILIRYQEHRQHAHEEEKFVDETHYKALLAKHPARMFDKVISPSLYNMYISRGMPNAFYYYIPKGSKEPYFVAIFGKQINDKIGNRLTDPGAYYNRERDLRIVNDALRGIGLPPVEILQAKRSIL